MCRGRKIILVVMACIGFGKDAAAVEWMLKGSLSQQVEYNDNISMNPVRNDSVVGYVLTPTLQASRKTRVLDIAFEGQGDIRRYDDSLWDCDKYNLRLNSDYRTKRSVFSLKGEYAVSCTYAQQILDTGLLLPNSQTDNYQLAPSWVWQWTPRDQLILDASYSRTSYSIPLDGIDASVSNDFLNFSGNETYTVNLGGNHEWSRRLSLNGKFYFSHIRYTGGVDASAQNLFGFQLGANYAINRRWTVSAAGGPIWIDENRSNSADVSSEQSPSLSLGSAANITLSYDDRLSHFSAGFSNAVNPSAIGQTLQTNSIFANYSYHLTRHLVLDFTSNFTRSESIEGQPSGDLTGQFDRSYFSVAAGIAWEFAKNWRLKGSYIYSWQDFQQDNQDFQSDLQARNLFVGTSDSNAVMVFLNYSWDGIRHSR